MLSWILVGVLYLCGMVNTLAIVYAPSIFGKEVKTNPTKIIPTLLAWPLVAIAGVILGVYLLVKGEQDVQNNP